MPYIKSDRRNVLAGELDYLKTPGELNYVITKKILEYLDERANYTVFNEVIGVLECVKQELYRRLVAPYEEKKMEENGDIFCD